MPKVITEDGAAQTWTAVYWRHHVRYEDDHESLEDALWAMYWGEEYEQLAYEEIHDPDGNVAMDHAAISAWCYERAVHPG